MSRSSSGGAVVAPTEQRRRSSAVLSTGVISKDRFDARVSAAYYLQSRQYLMDSESKLDVQLSQLDEAISNLPSDNNKKKEALEQAIQKGKVTQADKICFLRAEEFNADLAAERLRQHWEERLQLFGPDLAFEPLTLEGALRKDTAALETGFCQVTTLQDEAGRGILFLSPGKYDKTQVEVESMVRMIWYMVHAMLENDNVQKHGMILMVNPRNVGFHSISRDLQRQAAFSVSQCLPMRIGAFHVCQPSWIFRLSIPFLRLFIGPKLRPVFKVHAGKPEKIKSRLAQYGIQASDIPEDIDGGTMPLDHSKWLADRRAAGK